MRTLFGLLQAAMGITPEESGQRHAYLLTSDVYGTGAWRIVSTCDEAPPSDVIENYRKAGWEKKVWEFTEQVWEDAAGGKS